jgi:purine-binding chemotaxis protein CheW
VLGVEPLPAPEDGAPGLVRGVAPARAGAVTVLGPEALASEAERLFGGR